MTDELARWLENLGLEKFYSVLVEQEITFGDVSDLTENDLKEMGLPIGPRRRALKAIAVLAERNQEQPSAAIDSETVDEPKLASA